MKSKIIKSILSIAVVACFSLNVVKTTDIEQVDKKKEPVLYMQVDPGGTGG